MRWFISSIMVLALVGALWWMEQQRQAELAPEPDVEIRAEPQRSEPRHPLPKPEVHPAPSTADPTQADAGADPEERPAEATEPEPPLPDLADSDDVALQGLSDLLGNEFTQRWIKPDFVISRTVAIVNSLDGSSPSLKARPLMTLDTEPRTEGIEGEESLRWTADNAARYGTLIGTLESVAPERAAAVYGRHYPLFQQAWEELGEPEPYFNDRLIDVIDHLLATPETELPIEVVPYEGRLHFADESLQEESWGRKLLIRMGPAHAAFIKGWLRDFRGELDRSSDEEQDASP